MQAGNRTAVRGQDIVPLHVMESQTAMRMLEAAGRHVIDREIGAPDLPRPDPRRAAALAGIANGAVYYTPTLLRP